MNLFYCRRIQDLSDSVRSTTLRKGRRAFTLANAQPQYALDRLCDVTHIALTLHLDLAQKTLSGKCATTIRALSDAVSCIALDAVDLHITQVQQADGKPLRFDYDGRKLRAYPQPLLHSNAEMVLEIVYSVTKPRLGLYFIEPDAAIPTNPSRSGRNARTKMRASGLAIC